MKKKRKYKNEICTCIMVKKVNHGTNQARACALFDEGETETLE